jgi:hypothetical protein
MRIETSSPTVTEGQTLDLNCVVVGRPQATITWYKRGGSLPFRHQVLRGTVNWGGPRISQGGGALSHARYTPVIWTLGSQRQPAG